MSAGGCQRCGGHCDSAAATGVKLTCLPGRILPSEVHTMGAVHHQCMLMYDFGRACLLWQLVLRGLQCAEPWADIANGLRCSNATTMAEQAVAAAARVEAQRSGRLHIQPPAPADLAAAAAAQPHPGWRGHPGAAECACRGHRRSSRFSRADRGNAQCKLQVHPCSITAAHLPVECCRTAYRGCKTCTCSDGGPNIHTWVTCRP